MASATSYSSGAASQAGHAVLSTGETITWPASGLKYQVSATSKVIGQLRTSEPSGASKVIAVRR